MIRKKLTSDKLFERIITLTIIFLLVFFGVTILSYYLLPEGFLLNKNNGYLLVVYLVRKIMINNNIYHYHISFLLF